MNTTRLGKIARLPRFIRQQLNRRLEDGLTGEKLLEWVNGLPETQAMLAEEFDGKPINKQNLSDWRQGGHQDWMRAREDCELAASLAERAQELGEAAERPNLSDGLAMLLTLHLARQVKAWQSETGEPKERWRQLREMLRELALLRREDHRAERTEIARQKWHKQAEAMAEEKQEKLVDAAFNEITGRKVVRQKEAKSKSRPVFRGSSATEGGSSKSEATPRTPKGRKPKRNPPRKNGSHGTRTRKPKESQAKGKSKENSQPSHAEQSGTIADSLAPSEREETMGEGNLARKEVASSPRPSPPFGEERENMAVASRSIPSSAETPTIKDEKDVRQPKEPETPVPGTSNLEAISKRAGAAGEDEKNEGLNPSDSENRNPEPEKIEDPPSPQGYGATSPPSQSFGAAGEDEKEEGQREESEAAQSQSGPVKPSQAFELSDSSQSADGET